MRLSIAALILAHTIPVAAVDWQPIGPEGGSMDGFVQSSSMPSRIYALPYRSGVLRSEDGGASWARADTGLPMDARYQAIAVSSFDEDLVIIVAAYGDHVLRSMDGGVTWVSHVVSAGWTAVNDIAFDPHSQGVVLLAVAGGAGPGIHRSVDSGVTWSPSSTGIATLDPGTIEFHPTAVGVVLTGTADGAYRSTDGGMSWTLVNTAGVGQVSSLSFCAETPSRVWGTSHPEGAIFSDDEGLNFESVEAAVTCGYLCAPSAMSAAPDDPDVVLAGAIYSPRMAWIQRTVHRSGDGGQSWAKVYSEPAAVLGSEGYAALKFDRVEPSLAYLALRAFNLDGLQRSVDGGVTWTPWMNGIHGQPIVGIGRDAAGILYVRRQGDAGLWSADSGSTWTSHPVGFSGDHLMEFEVVAGAVGLLHEVGVSYSMDTTDPHFSKSTDGGQSWSWVPLLTSSLSSSPTAVTSSLSGDTEYVFTDIQFGGGEVFRRQTGEWMFTLIATPSFVAAGAVADPVDAMRVFALSDASPGEIFLTTDGGVTWTSRSAGLPSDAGVDVFLDPGDGNRLGAVFRTSGAYRSDDAGLTWTAGTGGPGTPVVTAAGWDPLFDRFFFVTQDSGVYVGGEGWMNDRLQTRDLTSLYYDAMAQRLLLGTEHASVQSLDMSGSGVAAPVVAARADKLEIRASPNPFTGTTRLDLVVPPGAADVDLAIFSVNGRRVAMLLNGPASPGPKSFTWDGRDDSGELRSSGVYFARLRVGPETVTRRIVRLSP